MKLEKRINITFIALLICFVLLIYASFAWLSMSLAPEVTSIDTNVGANGSLEIALLSDRTYIDPQLIRTKSGDSAAVQDVVESNLSWGNVIELSDESYGMPQLSLHPGRLNLIQGGQDQYSIYGNMLKIAQFGVDGRISVLSDQTVSGLYEDNDFVYYVANQKYGVRAIGTISHIAPQQTALATARTESQAHTAAASRTVKNVWRDSGAALTDIFYRRYAEGADTFGAADVAVVEDVSEKIYEAITHVELTIRQGMIGMAASRITDQEEFETLCKTMNNTNIPLSTITASAGNVIPGAYKNWITEIEAMKAAVMSVSVRCKVMGSGCTWNQLEPLLDILVDAEKVYLGDHILATDPAFSELSDTNVLVLAPGSGAMAELAGYVGDYSSFYRWTEANSVEVRTADPAETPHLLQIVDAVKNTTAASGGWTKAKLDDTYAFALDLAFRCNMDSSLMLQTESSLRVEEKSEFPVTQGGGSYMRFTSEGMELDRLLQLMDTIRIGFLDDKGILVALAKLNITNYEQQEEGVAAPLYLYEYSLDEEGVLTVGQRRSDDAAILPLNKNTPAVLTAVVWLDGDHVDNSHVGYLEDQRMSGVMNLQFASSADLKVSGQIIEDS